MRYLLWIAIFVFVLSTFFPGFIVHDPEAGYVYYVYGYELLGVGFLGVLDLEFGWFANIIIPFAFIDIWRKKYINGMITAIVAFLVGWSSTSVETYPYNEATMRVVDNVGYGFYLWELSFVLVFIYCLISYLRERSTTPSDNSPHDGAPC